MNLTINILDITGTSLSVDSIKINEETTNAASSLVGVVTPNGSATIEVTKAGYETYSMLISDVYAVDKSIDIKMSANITDTNSGDFNKPYPEYYSFQDSCSFRVDYYSATNNQYSTKWYIGNALDGTGKSYVKDFEAPGVYTVKMRQESYGIVEIDEVPTTIDRWDLVWGNSMIGIVGNTVARDTEEDFQMYLDLDTIANTTILEYRPNISITLDSSVPTVAGELETMYSRGTDVIINPSWTISKGLLSDYTVSFSATSPTGENVDVGTVTYPGTIDQSTVRPTFRVDTLGLYEVKATITDIDCGIDTSVTIDVETSNFVVIEPDVDCNTFHVYNRSVDRDMTITVEDYDNKLVPTYDSSIPINAGKHYSMVLPTGMFIITVTYEGGEESYVIGNYCAINNCLTSYIANVLCSPSECPCNYDVSEELAAMRQLTLMQSYFSYLTKTFRLNDFYTAMSDSDYAQIQSANSVLQKLQDYCSRIKCINGADCVGCAGTGIPNNVTQNGSGGCGC